MGEQMDLELMLGKEEQVAESFKEFLLDHIDELKKKFSGMNVKELNEYIERLMVM